MRVEPMLFWGLHFDYGFARKPVDMLSEENSGRNY